ncbi:MAG: BatA and WFA domain-containing protein [Bacteroidetes bacterium]|nr:BatA and WFA domain-containing protein [Bacteroidota bacterium]
MSFLYPLFLIAGLTLAIPVLIHLFNLRRYKTVMFPHVRFLKSIQLKSQKQSELKYKWLLALRLLFLASLILAFAQPFFTGKDKKETGNRLQVIYLDNSGSMSVKKGARTLFEVARDAAKRQVQQASAGSKFILLTNDKPQSYQPLPADKILTELNSIDISANSKPAGKILSTVQGMMQSEAITSADVYYYSDFQQNAFPAKEDKTLTKNIHFYGVAVQQDDASNIYIDTAYLDAPVLQTMQQNKLIVRSRLLGDAPKENPVLQLTINGQVKSAAALQFNDKKESIDTLSFSVTGAAWQQMMLTINDALRFDDTFRIAARSTPNLSVLVLNESQPNPYIQAAFRSDNGFQLTQSSIDKMPADVSPYNLIILNGITQLDKTTANNINLALQNGLSVCVFPAKTNQLTLLNDGLKQIGDIQFGGIDTSLQTATNLQQGNALVSDIFEHVPENVQLPTSRWHYVINAGLSANQQSVISFRNGDPLMAVYTPSKGQLYICASAADIESGNFANSYFFAPFLYKMAMQSRGGDMYALTLGKQQSAFLPFNNAGERSMVHITGNGINAIPAQRPAGKGLDVFIEPTVQVPGFYSLTAGNTDTATIALNNDKTESVLSFWSISSLKSQWDGENIHWMGLNDAGDVKPVSVFDSFPLWKVCAILALIMLAAETYVLAGGFRKQSAAI